MMISFPSLALGAAFSATLSPPPVARFAATTSPSFVGEGNLSVSPEADIPPASKKKSWDCKTPSLGAKREGEVPSECEAEEVLHASALQGGGLGTAAVSAVGHTGVSPVSSGPDGAGPSQSAPR